MFRKKIKRTKPKGDGGEKGEEQGGEEEEEEEEDSEEESDSDFFRWGVCPPLPSGCDSVTCAAHPKRRVMEVGRREE